MASIRNLSTRAKLLTRRYHPSITHYHHHHHHHDKPIPSLQGANYFLPQGPFKIWFVNSSVINRSCLDVPLSPRNLGATFSTTAGDDEPEKDNEITGITEILNDTSVQVHTPAVNEVAVAAADSISPVAFFQHFINVVHSFTGLNWWASIILATFILRGALLPIQLHRLEKVRESALLLPHMLKVIKELQEKDLDSKRSYSKTAYEFNMNMFQIVGGSLIAASVHVCFFMGILNMAEKVPSFKFGGAYWFSDLSTPDTLLIFPILTSVLLLRRNEGNANQFEGRLWPVRCFIYMFRAVSIISVPFTMALPKAVFFYWITSELIDIGFFSAMKKLHGAEKFSIFGKALKETKAFK